MALERRHGLTDLGQQRFQHILLLHALDVRLRDVIGLTHGEQQLREQLYAAPPPHGVPGARQGGADVPVRQADAGAHGIGALHRLEHLRARRHVHFPGDPLLKGGEQEVGQQQEGFLVLDDLDDVHVPPAVFLAQRLVAGGAQLDADGVGLFAGDHRFDQQDAFAGNVGRADQDDFLVRGGEPVDDVAVVVSYIMV